MTTGICIFCGSLKFGAFVPCQDCDRVPTQRRDVVRSLALTDHHFTHDELAAFGDKVRAGGELILDPELESTMDAKIDEKLLSTLTKLSDPEYRESRLKRERNWIIGMIVAILSAMAWMLYRFAIG